MPTGGQQLHSTSGSAIATASRDNRRYRQQDVAGDRHRVILCVRPIIMSTAATTTPTIGTTFIAQMLSAQVHTRRQQERQEWTASSLPRPSNVAWWRLALKVS